MFKRINIFFAISTLIISIFGVSTNIAYASSAQNTDIFSSTVINKDKFFLTALANKFNLNDTERIDALTFLYNIKKSEQELKNIGDHKQLDSKYISYFYDPINIYLTKEANNKYKLSINNTYSSYNWRTVEWLNDLLAKIGLGDSNANNTISLLNLIDKSKLIAMIAYQESINTPYGLINGSISSSIKNSFDRGVALDKERIMTILGAAASNNGVNGILDSGQPVTDIS